MIPTAHAPRDTDPELYPFAFELTANSVRRWLGTDVRQLGTARLPLGGILCHAEERYKQRYCDRGVAVPQKQ